MAKISIDQVEYEIPDGAAIAEACEKAGVAFSCNSGVCASCQIKILEGQENLTPLSQEEKDLGMDETHRLACQCTIKNGVVKVTY